MAQQVFPRSEWTGREAAAQGYSHCWLRDSPQNMHPAGIRWLWCIREPPEAPWGCWVLQQRTGLLGTGLLPLTLPARQGDRLCLPTLQHTQSFLWFMPLMLFSVWAL